MKTRNQLGNKVAPETTNNATNQPDNGAPAVSPPNRSPSPPRLRERRSSTGLESKSQSVSAAVTNQSPSPPVGAKRSSIGPTRILPRRSCGRPTSLLAGTQPSSSAIKTSPTPIKLPEQTSSKIDTQRQQLTSTPILLDPSSSSSSDVSNIKSPEPLLTTNKAANAKNYSREIPLTRSAVLHKHTIHDKTPTNNSNNKTKLVRISLPDNSCINVSGTSDSVAQNQLNSCDKDRYMFTINGLKKIGTVGPNAIEATTSKEATSSQVLADGSRHIDEAANLIASTKKIFNVLLGVTGSVATIKLVELTQKIKSMFPRPYASKPSGTTIEASINIKIVMTNNSKHFAPKDELIKTLNDSSIEVYEDTDEWSLWKKMNDPVLHIELRKWADLCLIAPLDANTMAKLANGICDNLLTCVVRAWDISKPLVYCPAMNVHMYDHPITREQLCKLQSFGYLRVDCVEKRLACGDFGMGGMASVDSIANKVVDNLIQPATRKLSLTRPLLNQQPTYPIMSTSEGEDANSRFTPSSISSQILNRFRTNNQITIHAVPNSRSLINNLPSSISSIVAGSALKKRRAPDGSDESNFIGNNNNGSRTIPTGNGQRKMGGVTSVQNMKAIGLDNGALNCNDESGYNVGDEDVGFDFDPSKLLEQTMITDDSITVDNDSRNVSSCNPGHSFDRSSLFGEESIAKMGGLTPLFNTSKFLALCQNKERGCFTCTICKHDYKNRKSMARHLKEQHVQGNIYQCKPCGVSYKRREKLIKHNRERHSEHS